MLNIGKLVRDVVALSSVGIISFFFGQGVMLALLNIPWWVLMLSCAVATLPVSVRYLAESGDTRIGRDEGC